MIANVVAEHPYLVLAVLAFIGACFGSFISLISYRLPRDLPVVAVHSRCPACQRALAPRDLMPVLSYLLTRGRCRHCKASVSWRYPAIECITAACFVGLYGWVGAQPELLTLLALAVCLIALIVTDLEHYLIPDEFQLALLIIGTVHVWLVKAPLPDHVMGLALGGAIGLGLHYGFKWWRKKDGLGLGDVKLMAVAGVWLGTMPMVPFLFYAGLLGVVTAVFWRLLGRGERYPFGPSLALSLAVCVVMPEAPEAFWQFQRWLWQG